MQEDVDWDDDEDDLDSFASDEDDDEPTLPCPYCGQEVHEDAQRCPHCGQYISAEDAPPSRKPWWIIAGVVVCLGIVYWWTFG